MDIELLNGPFSAWNGSYTIDHGTSNELDHVVLDPVIYRRPDLNECSIVWGAAFIIGTVAPEYRFGLLQNVVPYSDDCHERLTPEVTLFTRSMPPVKYKAGAECDIDQQRCTGEITYERDPFAGKVHAHLEGVYEDP